MKIFKRVLCIALIAIFATGLFAGCERKSNTIVVGAKDYTEQDVLGNIVSLLLEHNTDINIEYKHEMSSNVLFAAMKSGDIDICVDYTGTIYGSYLNYSDIKGADEVYAISETEMEEKFNLSVLEPLGFNNTYCLAVLPSIAETYNLRTYSDLAKVSSGLVFGGSFEILNRNDGLPKLKPVYDMVFKEEKAIEGVLRYQSIERGDTQVTEAFSTDGMLRQYDLVVLEDDKNFFPPYHAVPVIRNQTIEEYPQIMEILENLTNLIDGETMRGLNYKVDVEKQNAKDVATEFLTEQGLI